MALFAGLNTTPIPTFYGWPTCISTCWTTSRVPINSWPGSSGKLENFGHISTPKPPWRSCHSPVPRTLSSSLPKPVGLRKTSWLVHQGKRDTPRWEKRASSKSGLREPTKHSYVDHQGKGHILRSDNGLGYTWQIFITTTMTCNVRIMIMMRVMTGVEAS